MADIDALKLGKLPKQTDPRTLQAAKYIVDVPLPPAESDWLSAVPHIPMYANDRVGDCTCASAGHKIHAWRFYGQGQDHGPSEADVLAAYSAISGYTPDNPDSDVGATMLDVLKYWRKVGIGDHRIGAFVEVDHHDITQLRQAMWLFGGVHAGVQLPRSAHDEIGQIWQVHRNSHPWGGHAIAVNQFDPRGLTCWTWAARQKMTWDFLEYYADECYAVMSEDFLMGDVAPNGFDVAALRADLAALSGGAA